MKNTIKLDNPVQINGKSYDELTYDISEITAQAFAEADARKLSALHPRQLRRAIRDYARAFHTSTRDLGERRLTDFLTEYGEAVEEAKRFQASRPTRAASFKKPHIRRR